MVAAVERRGVRLRSGPERSARGLLECDVRRIRPGRLLDPDDGQLAMLWQPGILTTAWGPVVRHVAAGLDVELDPELEEVVERVPAEWDLRTASVDIAEGTMGAVRFQVVGKVDGLLGAIALGLEFFLQECGKVAQLGGLCLRSATHHLGFTCGHVVLSPSNQISES